MNNKLVIQMVKDGWNIREINDLLVESKRVEKLLADDKRYENKHKIINFKGITKYYCFKHECYHYKYRNTNRDGKIVKVKTNSFNKCKNNAYTLSDSETFKVRIKRSLKGYSVNSHKLTVGSKKQ